MLPVKRPASHLAPVPTRPAPIPMEYHNNAIVVPNHMVDENRNIRREIIEALVGFSVCDLSLYTQAFMHKSAVHVYGSKHSFERLEFMGDSVVNLMTTRYIFEKYDNVQEGFLTRLRTKIVSGKMLAQFATQIGLQNYVLMDSKAQAYGWNTNPRILEDVFESLIGAIYLDAGLEYCKRFFLPFIQNLNFKELLQETNYKDVLMRYCQMHGKELPVYSLMDDSNREFRVKVLVDDTPYGEGMSNTKKAAEQLAAKRTIEILEVDTSQLKRRS